MIAKTLNGICKLYGGNITKKGNCETSGSLILVFLLKKLGFEALPETVFDVLEFDAVIASQMVG